MPRKPRDKIISGGTCGKCGRSVVSCLWAGVDGWLCAACGLFWRKLQTSEPEGDKECLLETESQD